MRFVAPEPGFCSEPRPQSAVLLALLRRHVQNEPAAFHKRIPHCRKQAPPVSRRKNAVIAIDQQRRVKAVLVGELQVVLQSVVDLQSFFRGLLSRIRQ